VIIIFGLRRLRKGMGPVLLRCANCGMSPLVLFRVSTWFALFFIPLIPVSFKHYTACPNCKRLDEVSKADVERAREHAAAMSHSGPEETVATAGEPVTLESAVNEWAATGPAGLTAPVAGPPPLAPAGWYPDPTGGSGQRYWDGERWTEQTTPSSTSP
jgi:hypothetical protein